MDIQKRKLDFIQDFLAIQNEELILQFEKLLSASKSLQKKGLSPCTSEQLSERISQSEDDFKNDRFKTSAELLEKFKS